jgi:GT2 family glycosyltransferase
LKQPLFSIIIPTFNRPEQLTVCLKALAHLEYPRERFEVIVVDDGSEKPLHGVVEPFLNQYDLTLITQPNAGAGAARNTGAIRAKGKILAFTDDDCAPSPNWLKRMAAAFNQLPDGIIGGRVLNAIPGNPYSATSQLMHEAVYAYYNAKPNQAKFLATNNLALPADRFRTIGGFDTTFFRAEDNELCNRWLQHGYRMIYVPEIVVYHTHALTFSSFWMQHFNYGRAAYHGHQVSLRRGWGRVKVDPRFYCHLFRHPFRQACKRRVLLFEVLLLVSHIAKAAGFLREKTHRTELPLADEGQLKCR